jgi:ABC-type Zn2+ transport system substrate-binding protein/surface adhesin
MESKKLSQEELQQIKDLQAKSQAITSELGQIELFKIQIKQRRQNAEDFLKELEQEEKTLAEYLESVYGKGSINLEQGEFIPFTEEAEVVE